MRESTTNAVPPNPTPGTKAKPVSLRDLAAHLGLSRSTVSLVLNDSPLAKALTPATRERVLKAAAELNYKANYFARMLNNKRSHMVGILSPDLGEGYDSAILNGIERFLIDHQYLYFVSSHHWDAALIKQRMEVFAERGAEGIILINTPTTTSVDLPLVSIGSLKHEFPMTEISVDNTRGIQLALEHLFELGHRKIAFFKGHVESSDSNSRWEACQLTAQALGLAIDDSLVVQLERIDNGLSPIREGVIAAEQLLRSKRPFTALLAFNDLSAIGAINAFKDAGLRVPDDVSVVGFDDVQAATIVHPTLTTVRQPLHKMGMLAGSELLKSIENTALEPRQILIEPGFIVRKSTAGYRSN